jgi:hypothetical protein
MPTHVKDYTTQPNGAPQDQTHYGSGASSITSGRLLTTGLTNTLIGGVTVDVTASLPPMRVKGRVNLVDVGSGAGFGIPAGGMVLNYTHGTGSLGFLGFRVQCRYNHAAVFQNANIRMIVSGSRATASDVLLADENFLTGAWLLTSDIVNMEALYTPGVGAANGTLQYRAWREGQAVPAYKTVNVNSGYASISGPGGMMDIAGESLGSNTKWLSLETEGTWATPIAAGIVASDALSASLIEEFYLAAALGASIQLASAMSGWFACEDADQAWSECEDSSQEWSEE